VTKKVDINQNQVSDVS